MRTAADFEARLIASLDNADIKERYSAGDPLVVQQVRANAAYLALLAQDIDIATIEPFIKTRDRSILADASNKGILPVATPCRHVIEVVNSGAVSVTLAQGRLIEDAQGRPWRLLSSVTVAANADAPVLVEQSQLREIVYTVPLTQAFHKVRIDVSDGLFLAALLVRDRATPTPNTYRHAPRWMNAEKGEYAVTVTTDSQRQVFVEFGDDARVGRTALVGEELVFSVLECYGAVDTLRLKDAALVETLTADEQRVRVRFKQDDLMAYASQISAGSDPLSIGQLRLLASYPSLYDENAVFLGNFDYLVRKKFMSRCDYIAVWNEAIQERAYGVVNVSDINRLQLAVVAKNSSEQAAVVSEIQQLIGRADSLYSDRVKVQTVARREYPLTIVGRLAAVHDLDEVTAKIRGVLTAKYGKGQIAASVWLPDGFNLQELATLLRANVSAFQDRISDFSVLDNSTTTNKPHQWAYLTDGSIAVNLTRTADTGGALWTI